MKLTKIKIYGFGKWIDQEFDISTDYQVIFGQNEAGKTTLLTFIKSILFGFATNRGENKYQQYKPKHASKYGGELEFLDDKYIWTVIRVGGKSGGDLTLFRDDQQVPESLIKQITGGFSKEEYENTHILNDESIFSIYKMTEEQLETEIMSVGAVGSKAWLTTADELESDSEELYKSRGKKQPLVQVLEQNQKLLQKKASFENQQSAYDTVNKKIKSIEELSINNRNDYQKAIKEQNDLLNLSKKWAKFQEYQQLIKSDTSLPNPISTDDWEKALRINQELETLNNSQQSMGSLTAKEQSYLDFYRTNKVEIDGIKNHRNEIQQIQFEINNLNQSLNNNDNRIDQLFANDPQLDENMQVLTVEELNSLSKPTNKTLNTPLLAVSAAALLLAFFMSGILRVAAGIIFLISVVSAIYQQRSISETDISRDFLNEKGYSKVSLETVKNVQPRLIQLKQLQSEQKSLEISLKKQETQLHFWKAKLQKLNLMDSSNDLISSIDRYFNELSVIKAKAEVINSTQIESGVSKTERMSDLQQQLNSVLDKYQASTMDKLSALRTMQQDKRNLINQIKSDKEYLGDDYNKLLEFHTFEELSDKLMVIDKRVKDLMQSNDQMNRQMGTLKEKRDQIFDDREYRQVSDELTQNKADLIELYDDWLANKLASNWIHEMLNLASENRYPKMLNTAKRYFNLLTSGNYINIELKDNKLKLTNLDKTKFDVHELSKATTVQLYLSLRLAFIKEISDLVNLPILIDDAFVDFDSDRTENIMELVKDISKTNQIIYVTARLTSDVDRKHILKLEEDIHA